MHSPAPDPLSALLRRADPAAPSAPADHAADSDFASGVHARLRTTTTASSTTPAPTPGNVIAFPTWLTRRALPLAAALALLASLATGGSLAYAREQRIRADAYASAYARSIDPWLMHAARSVSPLATAAGASGDHGSHR